MDDGHSIYTDGHRVSREIFHSKIGKDKDTNFIATDNTIEDQLRSAQWTKANHITSHHIILTHVMLTESASPGHTPNRRYNQSTSPRPWAAP